MELEPEPPGPLDEERTTAASAEPWLACDASGGLVGRVVVWTGRGGAAVVGGAGNPVVAENAAEDAAEDEDDDEEEEAARKCVSRWLEEMMGWRKA